ncbi:MAG: hypothetical protein GY842_28855 [bacterium]|nr:hypothetical protein [bacterium]
MRKAVAPWLNLAVPGAGLILLRREWLGLTWAILFCLCAQTCLWGWLIVPKLIPGWLTSSAAGGAILTWVGAQYTLVVRLRRAFGAGVEQEVGRLCGLAQTALEAGDYTRAREMLLVALTLNDEDAQVNSLWAQLMTALGKIAQARRAWTRVVRLTRDDLVRRQADEARAALP